MKTNKPNNWRTGQYIFNLLEYMKSKGISGNQNDRLADTFHLSDAEFEQYETEFNERYNEKTTN